MEAVEEIREPAGGGAAFVQEASCAEQVVVLRVRLVGVADDGPWAAQRTILVVIGPSSAGIVTNDERRRAWGGKLPPGAVRQRAREDALESNRLVAIVGGAAYIDQDGVPRVIRGAGGRVVVADAPVPAHAKSLVDLDASERAALVASGHALLGGITDATLDLHRSETLRLLDKATQRIERRCTAIRGDLAKIGQADAIAAQAQWLIAEAARAPRGATKLVVTDWSTGEAVPMEVALDPAKSAKDQVAAMFKRAKRLRLGGKVANERLAQATRQLDAVLEAQLEVEAATTLGAIAEARESAKKSAPRDVTLPEAAGTGRARAATKTRVPYRTFFARSGRKLLVGKGAADNDAVSLHVARPHDLWLHAKDRTGAHVIVQLDKGQACPSEDLVDGAHLAAHFSDARDEKVVDVQYTDRRYLRKPKGSAPGFVIVDREKVLVLRTEPTILRDLLEREEI